MEYRIRQAEYGSFRWFATLEDQQTSQYFAVWLPQPSAQREALAAQGVTSDGCVRFFRTKRDLLASIGLAQVRQS